MLNVLYPKLFIQILKLVGMGFSSLVEMVELCGYILGSEQKTEDQTRIQHFDLRIQLLS